MGAGIIILVILLQYFFVKSVRVNTETSSWVSIPIYSRECEKPTKPYEINRTIVVKIDVVKARSTTYIKGNITMVTEQSLLNLQVKQRIFQLEGEKWVIVRMLNSDLCRGMVVKGISLAFGLTNPKDCYWPKGITHIDHVNVDKMEHMIWPTRKEFGYFLWIFEVTTDTETKICQEYKTLVKPLGHKTKMNKTVH